MCPLSASLVFVVLWAGIHLPLYVAVLERFAVLVPMFEGLSVAMAWVFLRTGKWMFLMLLFHSSLDTIQFVLLVSQGAHGTQTFAAIMGVTVAVAAVVLWRSGLDLGRSHIAAPASTLSRLHQHDSAARPVRTPGAAAVRLRVAVHILLDAPVSIAHRLLTLPASQ